MIEIILTVGIFILAFVLRLVSSISDTTDEDVSWWLIERQVGKKWINYKLDDSIIPNAIYGYPVLPHFIISKFPKKLRIIFGRLFNILPDFVVASCLLLLSNEFYSETFKYSGVIVSAMYLLSPVLLPMTARMKTIKGRSFGSMLVFLYFVSYYYAQDNSFFWILVFIFAVLTVQSSMFAFQTLFFFSFFFSIISLNPLPFVALMVIWTIAYFIPFLKVKEPFQFFYHHKIWYLRNYKKGTTAANRQNLKNLVLLPYYLFTNPRKFGALIFSDLPPVIFVIFIPEALYFILKYNVNFSFSNPFFTFSYLLFLSSLLVFLIINIRFLSFLGEAERYFEYSLPFLVILMPYFLYKTELPIVFALILSLYHITIILSIFIVSNIDKLLDTKRRLDNDYNKLVAFFMNLESSKILSIPTKLSFSLSYDLNKKNHQFYPRFAQYPNDKGFKIYEEDTNGLYYKNGNYESSFLVFKHTPKELKEKYQADYLIIEKEYIKGLEKQWGNFLHESEIILQSEKYTLLKL